jgi:hypothetical protein
VKTAYHLDRNLVVNNIGEFSYAKRRSSACLEKKLEDDSSKYSESFYVEVLQEWFADSSKFDQEKSGR